MKRMKLAPPGVTKAPKAAPTKGSGASLMVQVPLGTLAALRVKAAIEQTTVRALVLDALYRADYPVPLEELADRRRRR